VVLDTLGRRRRANARPRHLTRRLRRHRRCGAHRRPATRRRRDRFRRNTEEATGDSSWSISRKIALGFALGPLALIIIGFVAYFNTSRLLDSEKVLSSSYAMRGALDRIEIDLVNAETGQRGYLLTRNQSYLEPYDQARGKLNADIDSLDRSVAGEPAQQAAPPNCARWYR